jgi:hypothetical protein
MRKKLFSHKRGKISRYKGKYSPEKKFPLFISISVWVLKYLMNFLNCQPWRLEAIIIGDDNHTKYSLNETSNQWAVFRAEIV